MKIYHLHIISTEDTPHINEQTVLYKNDCGYFSSLKNAKAGILKELKTIESDFDEFPEFVHKIYCDEIIVDSETKDTTLYFNMDGDLIKRVDENHREKQHKFKKGDYVTQYIDYGKKIEIGVITGLPMDDDIYYTIHGVLEDDGYIDHHHLPEDWLYEVSPSKETKIKFELTLKKCLSESEYKLYTRKDKFKNII